MIGPAHRGLLGLIFLAGCATTTADFHTNIYHIPVELHDGLRVNKWQVSTYLDVAEASLRESGVRVPISVVHLYPLGGLFFDTDGDGDLDPIDGLAHISEPHKGLACTWSKEGARSYAHERLHQDGLNEFEIDATSVDEIASQAAFEAAFGL